MFITLEGIEGVGKSTHLKFLAEWLSKMGIPFITTREPGGTKIGEEIREILLKHRTEKISSITELLLMFSARVEHLSSVIRPALEKGHFVLCDRFTDATYAYQGGGRGIPIYQIALLENLVQGDLRPNLVFIFDAPPAVGLSRAKHRSNPDRFEQEELDFFERVRNAYLVQAKTDPTRYKVLDATQSISAIQAELVKIMESLVDYHV